MQLNGFFDYFTTDLSGSTDVVPNADAVSPMTFDTVSQATGDSATPTPIDQAALPGSSMGAVYDVAVSGIPQVAGSTGNTGSGTSPGSSWLDKAMQAAQIGFQSWDSVMKGQPAATPSGSGGAYAGAYRTSSPVAVGSAAVAPAQASQIDWGKYALPAAIGIGVLILLTSRR